MEQIRTILSRPNTNTHDILKQDIPMWSKTQKHADIDVNANIAQKVN
jgi:hypothetical protein